jgi:beta-glucanase (GH16 family)
MPKFATMTLFLASLGALTFAASSCEKTPEDPIVLPENFVHTLTLSSSAKGQVDAVLTADKVNYYSIEFIDIDGPHADENTTGKFSYKFANSGKYAVRMRAHTSAIHFVEAIDSVSINEVTLADGYTTPTEYAGYNLVWADEFNGNALNLNDWTHEIGTGNWGWGNNELQYYTDGTNNLDVSGGKLTITAKSESQGSSNYTSARIKTQGKKEFQYGRIDIRARLPRGQGIWPALWMLGSNISSVGWPNCGEIDIMELVGHQPNRVHGTVHFGTSTPSTQRTSSYSLGTAEFGDEFHVFTLIWEQNKMEWYVDDKKYHTVTSSGTGGIYPFNDKFFFIFNVAVGGQWPGSPDATTVFPQQMEVDYIRVFQKP